MTILHGQMLVGRYHIYMIRRYPGFGLYLLYRHGGYCLNYISQFTIMVRRQVKQDNVCQPCLLG